MDRVLLVIDDVHYANHLEMTFRKVGFEVEHISTEFNLSEKLLTFNPDYVIAKGSNNRVSSLNVGKKLKESVKFLGKVILIFSEDQKSTPDEFIKLRMDLLLFEPISGLRVVTHVLNLSQLDKDAIMEKLLRFARTDAQFRAYESSLLKNSGGSIETEIQIITNQSSENESGIEDSRVIDQEDIMSFVDSEYVKSTQKEIPPEEEVTKIPGYTVESDVQKLDKEDYQLTEAYKAKILSEIKATDKELPLRIESYNRVIKSIDQDLKMGLKKRQTRSTNKKFFKDIPQEDTEKQDIERRKFAQALFKKKDE